MTGGPVTETSDDPVTETRDLETETIDPATRAKPDIPLLDP
ncbi:hypothetical protein [Natronorubrum sp. FCH18a]